MFEEITAENFPNLGRKQTPRSKNPRRFQRRNPKRCTPRHIITEISKVKDKERILKAAREKQLVTCKETPIRLSADSSAKTLQARRKRPIHSKC